MKAQMLSPGLCLVPVQPKGHRDSGGGWGFVLQLHPWCCGTKALVPLGNHCWAVQVTQASLERLVLQGEDREDSP